MTNATLQKELPPNTSLLLNHKLGKNKLDIVVFHFSPKYLLIPCQFSIETNKSSNATQKLTIADEFSTNMSSWKMEMYISLAKEIKFNVNSEQLTTWK